MIDEILTHMLQRIHGWKCPRGSAVMSTERFEGECDGNGANININQCICPQHVYEDGEDDRLHGILIANSCIILLDFDEIDDDQTHQKVQHAQCKHNGADLMVEHINFIQFTQLVAKLSAR